jgi:hypothetical protein
VAARKVTALCQIVELGNDVANLVGAQDKERSGLRLNEFQALLRQSEHLFSPAAAKKIGEAYAKLGNWHSISGGVFIAATEPAFQGFRALARAEPFIGESS